MMAAGGFGPIPYIPDVHHLAFDAVVCFIVSALLAIMINAEAQAWMATLLGDSRPDAKDRFHFNVLFHLSLPGSICYLLGGFGWPKPIDIDPTKFHYPRLFTIIVRFTGPIANILLANIAASIIFVFKFLDMDPLVFMMVAGVNLTTAIYHLIPIPPLAAGTLITVWIPQRSPVVKRVLYYSGSFLLVAIFLIERSTGVGLLSPYLNPLVNKALNLLVR
jgi:Zn-dependent protease